MEWRKFMSTMIVRRDGLVKSLQNPYFIDQDYFSLEITKYLKSFVKNVFPLINANVKNANKQIQYLGATYISHLFEERIGFADIRNSLGRGNAINNKWESLNKFYARTLRGPGISDVFLGEKANIFPWITVKFTSRRKKNEPLWTLKMEDDQGIKTRFPSLGRLEVSVAKINTIFEQIKETIREHVYPAKGYGYGLSDLINKIWLQIINETPMVNISANQVGNLKKWLGIKEESGTKLEDYAFFARDIIRPLLWNYIMLNGVVEEGGKPINIIKFMTFRVRGSKAGVLLTCGYASTRQKGIDTSKLWRLRSVGQELFIPLIELEKGIYDQKTSIVDQLREQTAVGSAYEFPSSRVSNKFISNLKIYGPSDIPIRIGGGRGTGKSTVAKHLHNLYLSNKKAHGGFLEINCATLNGDRFETDLFGADGKGDGAIEVSRNGTLFLDEFGTLQSNPEVQGKLLVLLQAKKYLQSGSSKSRTIKFRLISATLEEMTVRDINQLARDIGKGFYGIRSDLYDRINGIEIKVPALKERFNEELVPRYKRPNYPPPISDESDRMILMSLYSVSRQERYFIYCAESAVKSDLVTRDWPGNIRDFKNRIEVAYLNARADKRELIVSSDFQWKNSNG